MDISLKKKQNIFSPFLDQLFARNKSFDRKILNDIAKIEKKKKKLTITAMFVPQHKSNEMQELKSDYVFCYNI